MEFLFLIIGGFVGIWVTMVSIDTEFSIRQIKKEPCISKDFGDVHIKKCYEVKEISSEQK